MDITINLSDFEDACKKIRLRPSSIRSNVLMDVCEGDGISAYMEINISDFISALEKIKT
jgi:hypothetical protein